MSPDTQVGDRRILDPVQAGNFLRVTGHPEAKAAGLRPEFLRGLLSADSTRLVSNVETTFFLARVDPFCFPVTVNDTEYENSYVCSPYTGMISYSLEELENIDSVTLRTVIRLLATGMSPLLKLAKINRVACVNNSMLSTNLYPNWEGEHLLELTQKLTGHFPRHAIMFRSLNVATTPRLCEVFQSSDYQFVPSRLLYVIDPADRSILEKRNVRIDYRLMRESPYTIVRHDEFTDDDDARVKSLYDELYLGKYSEHNPQFTTELIRLFRKTSQLEFMGLRNSAGILVGVIATLELNHQFTTPIVGYDFSVPRTAGLYRLLTALVIQKAFDENKLFNMSSGVGKFKQHRGATPQLEYSAIYTRHLRPAQRTIWKAVGWMMENIAAPLVQKHEL